MRVQIDQAGQERRAAEIDHARVGRNWRAGADRLNAIAADDDDARGGDGVAGTGDEVRRPHDDCGRGRRWLRAHDGRQRRRRKKLSHDVPTINRGGRRDR